MHPLFHRTNETNLVHPSGQHLNETILVQPAQIPDETNLVHSKLPHETNLVHLIRPQEHPFFHRSVEKPCGLVHFSTTILVRA